MQQERSAQRRRVLKAGQILFGASAIDCVVRNSSATGACILLKSPLWFPESFVLAVASDGVSRRCHIVWRKEGQIGIAFDD